MSVKRFVGENELNYQVPFSTVNLLISTNVLRLNGVERIEQIWLPETIAPNGHTKIRTRLRHISVGNAYEQGHKWSYDTKYDLTSTSRIELSAPLTVAEYELLTSIYPDTERVNKSRLLLTDDTGRKYECDIYPNNPLARIEIEFDTVEEMKSFVVPEWLKEAMVK